MSQEQSLFVPTRISDALSIKRRLGDRAVVIAGGTITVPLITKGIIEPEGILSLSRLPLQYINQRKGSLEIGALTPLSRLAELRSPRALVEAARSVHGWAVRSMGTVGGNIFAPAPGGDVATALMALGGELVLMSGRGRRSVGLEKFYKGVMKYDIRRDEILTAVRVRRVPTYSSFTKLQPLRMGGPTIASAAVSLELDGRGIVKKAMIALGCITHHPYRAAGAEKRLVGRRLDDAAIEEAASRLLDGVAPIQDANASSRYRARIAPVLFRRAVDQIRGEVS